MQDGAINLKHVARDGRWWQDRLWRGRDSRGKRRLCHADAGGCHQFPQLSGRQRNPAERCEAAKKALAGKNFDDLLQAHVADHQRLFRRVTLDLGTTEAAQLPTDQRLKQVARQPIRSWRRSTSNSADTC